MSHSQELGVEIEEVSVPMGIACKSVSTYPAGTQGAAVICDQYRIRKLGNRCERARERERT